MGGYLKKRGIIGKISQHRHKNKSREADEFRPLFYTPLPLSWRVCAIAPRPAADLPGKCDNAGRKYGGTDPGERSSCTKDEHRRGLRHIIN